MASGPSVAVAYLDSSALVKLIALEPETAALRHELGAWPRRTSSLLAAVELTRTAGRLGSPATALVGRVLAGLTLLAIDPIVPAATQLGGPLLRSLDGDPSGDRRQPRGAAGRADHL
ncbi:MAG: hypothetical protein WAL63_20450 [Solirubrobacteraceae bacterium]